MALNSYKNIFHYFVSISGLTIKFISDEKKLLKLDFVNNIKNEKNILISEPIQKTLSFIDDYFSGKNSSIEICFYKTADSVLSNDPNKLYLDMSEYTEKEIEIYRKLLNVKPGKMVSYSELALNSGITGGARFAGNCMARNRFPIIIPCHRVVKKDGSMGNYTGGVWIKELLLKHEQSYKWS